MNWGINATEIREGMLMKPFIWPQTCQTIKFYTPELHFAGAGV